MRRPYLANGTRFERPEAPARVEHIDALDEASDWPTANVYPPSFGLLASDASWRKSWSHIVAGRFSPSHYSGLLFVEASTGYAELYDTDGQGRISAPFRRRYRPLGGRTSWTHVVPGLFGDSGFSGLLLYDRAAGFGRVYDNNGQGDLRLLREYTDWRSSWTHIVAGRFVPDLPYASLFFYSATENYAEIWATNRHGLAGNRPQMAFPDFSPFAFTQVLGGDFHWTPGFILSTPTLTDLFFYDGQSGYGEMHHLHFEPPASSLVLSKIASKQELPRFASVVAGSFGGFGNTDLAFYERKLGTLSFYAFRDTSETASELVLRETHSGLRRNVDIVVSGNFWMSNAEDHWFAEGPPVANAPHFDPDWRFNVGPFSDLLLYDREAGLGEVYFHEPSPPTAQPLTGYVTSFTSVAAGPLVSTGSVLPGERVAFHISSHVGPYAITIHQLGYFGGGETERFMLNLEGMDSAPAPMPIDRDAYRNGAQWPESASLVVPLEWPSGLYVARVRALGSTALSIDLPFVVRARPSARVGILFVLADTTYCAYNDWGGRNSYGHLSGDDFVGAFPSTSALRIPYAFRLSFERPSHGGFGNVVETTEIPFLRWLGRRGIAVDVCTSRDLHFEAPSSRAQRLLLFVGHHEYWTAKMRDHVEGFVRSGGNVGIFSGNTCWWQVRLSDDGRELLCYKVAAFDPVSRTSERALTTAHWFDQPVNRPETRLTGVSWLGDGGLSYDQNHCYFVRQPEHWVFAGTNLQRWASFGYYLDPASGENRSVVGPETDRFQTGKSGLTSPADYTLASVYHPEIPTLEVGTMGIFRPGAESGQVFNAATINWALGLSHDPDCTSVLDRITLNVIARLGPARDGQWSSVSEGRTLPLASIAAVAIEQNEVALFLADAQGGVYTTSGSTELGWRPWTSVSEGSTLPGAPISAVPIAPNRIALFLADASGGVYTTSGNSRDGWRPWTSVSEGSTTPGGHVTALLTGQSQVALFLADRAGSVYTSSGNPDDGFGAWSSVAEGSTMPGAKVTAVRTGLRQISLFLADPGGGVYTISCNAEHGWGSWTSVSEGSTTPGAPIAAARTAQNQVALFVADPSGGIYTTAGNAQGWQSWSRVSELTTLPGASITALPTGSDRLSLFLADRDGEAATTSGSAHNGWRPWMSVFEGSTMPGAPLAAVLIDAMHVAVFLADRSGGVYTTTVPVPLG